MRSLSTALFSAALLVALPPLSAAPLSAQSDPGILVSVDWLAARLGDPQVVVLHAEYTKPRYAQGHVPGARFLDMTKLVWDGAGDPGVGTEMRAAAEIEGALEAAGVRDGQHIVIYGANALAAARAWMTLDVMGLDRISLLDGGMAAWRQAGKPFSDQEPAAAPGSVTLRPRPGVMVDSDWILSRLEDPSITLIDARPDEEYTGADGGMGGRVHAGHIPGAYQIYWEKMVESRDLWRARPRDDLKALFAASGAAEGSTLVIYCMVGLRASYAYLVARMLGYDAKFYDGSWHDWGGKDLPYVSGTSRR
jgi:thiosulfate/3-mercaptopyruvate sulfurtransferase